jgi:hypothetical protein
MTANVQSTALLSARTTVRLQCSHVQPPRAGAQHASGDCRVGCAEGSVPKGTAGSSSTRWQVRVAHCSTFEVWKAGVPMAVPAASRPSGSCLMPSWPATAVTAAWLPERPARLAGWEWGPRGALRAVRAANACVLGTGAPCRKVLSASASGRASRIAATSSKGPCSVRANRSGPRGSPYNTPIRELTTVPTDWWTMRRLCLLYARAFHPQQGGAALSYCCQHLVPALQGLRSVPPVHQRSTGGFRGHAKKRMA